MKNEYAYTMSEAEFWNYITSKVKILLNDMETFQYSHENLEKKIQEFDLTLATFILGMKFVAYEEEIVDDKKKNIAIEQVLGKDIIDKFVNNQTGAFEELFPWNTLTINGPDYVLKDEEHDARWVLGVIKKCIAHGNFSLDFNKGVYIINNCESPNELYCEVGWCWLAYLGNYISPNRDKTVNFSDLLLNPCIFSILEKPLNNDAELIEYLKNELICYFPVLNTYGSYAEKLEAKQELIVFWNHLIRECGFLGLQKLLDEMPNLEKKVKNGEIRLFRLGEPHFNRIVSEVNDVRDFYNLSSGSQQIILESIMYDIGCIEMFPNQSHNIDYGLDLVADQIDLSKFREYIEACLERNTDINPGDSMIFSDLTFNYGNFKKKMALSYFLGILLFAGNKDEIYDELLDYDQFDLSFIKAYDISSGIEIKKIIDRLSVEIGELENLPTNKKIEKKIKTKKSKLDEFERKLLKDFDEPAIRPSNREILHRIRNSFSHKQIYNLYITNCTYDIADSIDREYIVLADEDKFVAYVNVDDLLNLLMDSKFYEALRRKETLNQKTW